MDIGFQLCSAAYCTCLYYEYPSKAVWEIISDQAPFILSVAQFHPGEKQISHEINVPLTKVFPETDILK
jgi:hypothetical protein